MNIFLTGATGLVGGELLVTLSKRNDVNRIYCFIRAESLVEALIKLHKVFSIHDDDFDETKIIPVIGNLLNENLTANLIADKSIADTNVVIHSAADTSFSKIHNDMVEKVNINGLEKVLLWAKQLPLLNTFLYLGTASISGKEIKHRIVFEDESPNINVHHLVKYTYTKMHGELLVNKHIPAEKILIARPSIIMGDSRDVFPRSPVILWAVAAINHLRLIPVNEHALLDMVPVDFVAKNIVSLLFNKNRQHQVYHISAGKNAATTALQLSKSLSAYFKNIPPYHFTNKTVLNQIKLWAKNKLNGNSEIHNYPEHLEYWKKSFTEPSSLRILFAGLDPYFEFMELGQVFDNSRLQADVPDFIQSPPAHEYINNMMMYIEKIDVMEGALTP